MERAPTAYQATAHHPFLLCEAMQHNHAIHAMQPPHLTGSRAPRTSVPPPPPSARGPVCMMGCPASSSLLWRGPVMLLPAALLGLRHLVLYCVGGLFDGIAFPDLASWCRHIYYTHTTSMALSLCIFAPSADFGGFPFHDMGSSLPNTLHLPSGSQWKVLHRFYCCEGGNSPPPWAIDRPRNCHLYQTFCLPSSRSKEKQQAELST